jgi:hypothetical protein
LNVVVDAAAGVGKTNPHLVAALSRGLVDGMSVTFDPGTRKVGVRYAELYAEAKPKVSLPVGFQDRLVEAVSFVTAALPTWVMTETEQGGIRTVELFKTRPSNSSQIVRGPWMSAVDRNDEHFYSMLASYYKYSCVNSNGTDHASLSGAIGKLYSLKNVWLDTVALIVSVAVETILSESKFENLGLLVRRRR